MKARDYNKYYLSVFTIKNAFTVIQTVFIVLGIVLCGSMFSQIKTNPVKDVVQKYTFKKKYTQDTLQFKKWLLKGNSFRTSILDSAIFYHRKAKKLAFEIKNEELFAESLNAIGYDNSLISNYDEALRNYQGALSIVIKYVNSSDSIIQKKYLQRKALMLNAIGIVYYNKSVYPFALENLLSALKINQQLGNEYEQIRNLNNIGNIFIDQGDYKKALDFLSQALKINENLNDKASLASTLIGIGNASMYSENYKKALDCYLRAYEIGESFNNLFIQNETLGNIGVIYLEQSNYPKALEYLTKVMNISKKTNNKRMLIVSLDNLSTLYEKQKKYNIAESYSKQNLNLSIEAKSLMDIKLAHQSLYNIYFKSNRSALALEHYKQFIMYRDSINNLENAKALLQKEMQYNYDKKATAISIKTQDEKKISSSKLAESQAKLKLETNQKQYLYIIIIISFVLAAGQFYNYRRKVKSNKLLEIQKQQIEEKNELLEMQKKDIVRQQELITDSIEYARTIQESMLPDMSILKKYFSDTFIYYQPKDIVSGDFYWLRETPYGIALSLADCTGHGVSGALLSVLGHTSLDTAYQQLVNPSPADVIKYVDNYIKQKTKNQLNTTFNIDGMALSLIHYNAANKKITYSLANQQIYLVRNKELIRIKGNNFSIGSLQSQEIIMREMDLQKDDMLYLYSDGYADQKGGPEKRKLMYSHLKKMCIQAAELTGDEQKLLLKTELDNWKGTLPQVDDILVIGLKI